MGRPLGQGRKLRILVESLENALRYHLAPVEAEAPVAFVVLVVTLSVPFWLAGALTDWQPVKGLPASSFMFLCPVTAAAILTYRERGRAGVVALLKRAFDAGRIPAWFWYGPALLLMPGLVLLAYGIMRWTGMPLPEEPRIPILEALILFGVFVLAALGEELGWSGYATDPLADGWGIGRAGILLGLVWGLWHVVPYLQAGRSLAWIFWYGLVETVSLRVLMVWLYRSAGRSVLAAALFHATVNVTFFCFPNRGSHYDPRLVGLLVALAAALVTLVWAPGRVTRLADAGSPRSDSPHGFARRGLDGRRGAEARSMPVPLPDGNRL